MNRCKPDLHPGQDTVHGTWGRTTQSLCFLHGGFTKIDKTKQKNLNVLTQNTGSAKEHTGVYYYGQKNFCFSNL